MQQTTTFSVLK